MYVSLRCRIIRNATVLKEEDAVKNRGLLVVGKLFFARRRRRRVFIATADMRSLDNVFSR